jgi:hypothetical protein
MANETPTLISQGVTLFSGFELGWLFNITRSEHFLLSGSLGIKKAATTDVYLQRFIEGIMENGGIRRGNRLVQTTPTLRGEAGLHGAYAISDLVGLTFVGDADFGETSDRKSSDKWFYSIAAAVDFNLHRHNGIPAGFIIGLRSRSNPLVQPGVHGTGLAFFGRIGYTGSRDFSFGIDLGYELSAVRGLQKRQGFLSALVDTRLYL